MIEIFQKKVFDDFVIARKTWSISVLVHAWVNVSKLFHKYDKLVPKLPQLK